MKNIAIFLGHPAHFHLFKNVAKNLIQTGFHVSFVMKKKDILEKLLQDDNLTYYVIREGRSNTILGLIKSVIQMEIGMARFIRKNHIELLIGSTLSFATRVFTKSKVVVTGEDDASLVPIFARMVFPFVNEILSPISCNNERWNKKTIKYNSYQKLAYLHPNNFTPNINIVKKYFSPEKPYFLLRFAKLNAYHDLGIHGISTEIAKNLINILKKHGSVYITSERELEPQFEQYRLNINLLDIHHIMAFSTLYIGDSQSMSVEAAMLGVPSVRFNDFAGKIGVLEELEHKYHLTFGIKSSEPEKLYQKVEELLNMNGLYNEFQVRRQRMLADKIDCAEFLTWFIGNYPDSKKIMKENPDYQYKFK
jgi:predicted glycosyltransferase